MIFNPFTTIISAIVLETLRIREYARVDNDNWSIACNNIFLFSEFNMQTFSMYLSGIDALVLINAMRKPILLNFAAASTLLRMQSTLHAECCISSQAGASICKSILSNKEPPILALYF